MYKMETREQKLKQQLKLLGDSSKQIAKSLLDMGIKGIPESMDSCPIANYLKRLRYKDVSVDIDYIDLETRSKIPFSLNELPKACAKFIADFDNEKYKNLIK